MRYDFVNSDVARHVVRYNGYIDRQLRNTTYGHRSGLVWFTGLPSSGKSTIAHIVEKYLFEAGVKCYVFDGDNVRHGLNSDLGFSREDRKENLRRIAEVAKLFIDAGIIVLAAFVSPLEEDRMLVRDIVGEEDFFLVYVKCSPEVCEMRDPKGNYKKAKQGIIKNYTGVSAPYEEPTSAKVVLDTEKNIPPEVHAKKVISTLNEEGWFPSEDLKFKLLQVID